MAYTGQTVVEQSFQLTQGTHSASTNYDAFTAGGASTIDVIKSFVLINNDANASHTVTVTKQQYSGASYAAVLTQTYTLAANTSEVPWEFSDVGLNGDATNPDKIVVQFGTALGDAGDTIDVQALVVRFS